MDPWAAVASSLGDEAVGALRTGPEPDVAVVRLANLLEGVPQLAQPGFAAPLTALAGASRALLAVASSLGSEAADVLTWDAPPAPVLGGTADPLASIQRGVAAHVLGIAALDLTDRLDMPAVGRALSDLADAAASAALDAVAGNGPRMAVIALGKWGGGELNYASDIDLLFVHDGNETEAGRVASR
ncbi:MAG: hypothetical protein Q8Q29_01565, partial [Actinomycetota bacterium]|nr:hypothetical protein [Actinomycetota bacterium]